MKHHSAVAIRETEVQRACSHFLEQARVALPLDALTVIMLDPGEGIGRVVFSWRGFSDGALRSDIGHVLDSLQATEQQSVLHMTMHGGEGPVGGVLLHCSDPNGFNSLEHRLARDISQQLAIQLENVQLRQRLHTTADEMALMGEVAQIVASSPSMAEIFERLLPALSRLMDFDTALLSWIGPYQCEIYTLQSAPNPPNLHSPQLSTPIIYGNRTIGSLSLHRSDRPFNSAAREILSLVSTQIAPAIQDARFHQSPMSQPRLVRHQTNRAMPDSPNSQEPAGWNQGEPSSKVDLAHALYSPLTVIKGYTSSLLQPDSDWPPEIQQEFFQSIDQAADRLNQAIRELLLTPAARLAALPTKKTPIEVEDLLGSVFADPLSNIAGARVYFQCQVAPARVLIDPSLIKQVIQHLIDCVLDTMGPGETLLVEASQGTGRPVISVGPPARGQQPEQAESPVTSIWDNDLRIEVCRNILEAHGTVLLAEAMPEGASRFWFTLPPVPAPGLEETTS